MIAVPTQHKLYGWHLKLGRQEYMQVLDWQHGLVKMRGQGFARDTIITVEHPPVLTVGKDDNPDNYKDCPLKPVSVERGGDVTYHGPGQLVMYFIFNLTRRGRDVRKFMDNIQEGIIRSLAEIDVTARRDEEHTGVWVDKKKIASVGVAIKKWISFHGAAFNLNTSLEEFDKINPCGLKSDVMTSVKGLTGEEADFDEWRERVVRHYCEIFDTDFTPVLLEELAEDVESQSGGYEI